MKRYIVWLIGLVCLISPLVIHAGSASAHSLDQYVQASYITVAPSQIGVELDVTPGVLIAPQVLALLDANGDQQISDAEGQAYAARILKDVTLTVDGQPQVLRVTKIEMPTYLVMQAGYGTMRVFTQTNAGSAWSGTHQLAYTNSYQTTGIAYQVNAFLDDTKQVTLGTQNRDATQQSITMDFIVAAGTATTTTANAPVTSATSSVVGSTDGARQLLGFVSDGSLSVWMFGVAALLAMLLGGLHALTPGHGKTLIAAYLVGNRGRARDAVMLGGIVTFTHTISVIVIGLLSLVASQFIVPTLFVPTLEIISGLLVLSLGLRLLVARLRAVGHANNRHGHSHRAPTDTIRMRDLLAMGVSGGLVPCPEALGVLLIAISLNRIGLGLALIVAFSLGVAVVIITIGLVLVRSRGLLERMGRRGRNWQRWLPLVSAGVVTLLGGGIVVKGWTAFPADHIGLLMGGVVAVGIVWLLVAQYRRSRTPSVPRVATRRPISNAPMAAAPMRYTPEGQVAWDEMWTDFCDLALDGGPAHRATLLEAGSPEAVYDDLEGYARVQDELARGLRLVTECEVVQEVAPGWIGLVCADSTMAAWLAEAIVVENVAARAEGRLLLVPAAPSFEVGKEIKNVITAVAKTHHYWCEHHPVVVK